MPDPSGSERFAEFYVRTYDELAKIYLPMLSGFRAEAAPAGKSVWDFTARLRSGFGIDLDVMNDGSHRVCLNANAKLCVFDSGDQESGFAIGQRGLWTEFAKLLARAGDSLKLAKVPKGLLLKDVPLIFAPPWQIGHHPNLAALDIFSALSAFPKTVLLGPPGSGKSTIARCVALAHCSKISGINEKLGPEDLGFWPSAPLTPVFIELRKLFSQPDADLTIGEPRHYSADNLLSFIQNFSFGGDKVLFEIFLSDLAKGQALIVLDGLDETPVPSTVAGANEIRGSQIKNMLRSFSQRYPRTKVIVTSRPAAYSSWSLDDYEVVRLLPLNRGEREQVARKTFLYLGVAEAQIDAKVRVLDGEFSKIPQDILQQPLFVSLFASLFAEGKYDLAGSKVRLLKDSIQMLLANWSKKHLDGKRIEDVIGFDEIELEIRLSELAFDAHSQQPAGDDEACEISVGALLQKFFDPQGTSDLRRVWEFLTSQAGVLVAPTPDKLRFAHRQFQEYLCARHLFSRGEAGLEEALRLFQSAPQIWWQVNIMLFGIAGIEERFDLQIQMLFNLSEFISKRENLGAERDGFRLLCDSLNSEPLANTQSSVLRGNLRIISSAIDNFVDENMANLSPVDFAAASEACLAVGSRKPGTGLRDGLPDIQWVSVEAGDYQIGSNDGEVARHFREADLHLESDVWDFTRESPRHSVRLNRFEISQYAVTNEQFLAFVDSPDGYANDAWWTSDGVAWRNENGPIVDSRSNREAYPVANVSWYEAYAFCRWLSEKLGTAVRLPTEAEWEASGKRTNSNQFPIGFDPRVPSGNLLEAGIGRVLPVGSFPNIYSNATPSDLLGNIWEWCSSCVENEDSGETFAYPYDAQDGREDPEAGATWMRAVRGGYFENNLVLGRLSYRGRDAPGMRAARQGFRIVRQNATVLASAEG